MNKILYFLFLIVILFSCENKGNEKTKGNQLRLSGYWYEQPLRIQQTVLRQPDVIDYRVDSVVQYLKSTHTNVLVINGGGIVDYFQNTLPLASVNQYLGERDLLKEVVDSCHANNIKVITRVDFRGVEKHRYEQHPDWFGKDAEGNPIILDYNTPELYAPCYNGYYRNAHAVEFISNLFEKYKIDGIWHNAVNFHQVCYCQACRDKYYSEYERGIPTQQSDRFEWEQFYKWKAKCAGEQLTLMQQTVKKYGEDKVYTAEVFSMFDVNQQKHTGIDLYSAARYFDFLVTVSFLASNRADVEYKDLYYSSAIVKFLKSLKPGKSPVILFGGNGTEHRYIYDPPVDSRQWLWEAAAVGGGFWNCYFNGSYPAATLDTRNAFIQKDAYAFQFENRSLIQGLQPVMDVAIFYSKASGQLLGDEEFALPIKGILRLLHETHIQYGFVTDHQLTSERLKACKVLILPNVASLKDEDAGLIRNWVKDGGKLIATFATSLFDESGNRREDFLLADLFGCHFTGEVANTQVDCYQKAMNRNAVLDGFEQTTLLHNGGSTLLCKISPGVSIVTGYLPKINNQPPENAYPETWESEFPVIVDSDVGKGRVIYFANQPDRLNYTVGHPDYHNLLHNAIRTLLGQDKILITDAPASVHVYLNQSDKDSSIFLLSLVNATSGSMRPMRDLVPVYDISVEVPFTINSGNPISDTKSRITIKGNKIHIDELKEYCSIVLYAE